VCGCASRCMGDVGARGDVLRRPRRQRRQSRDQGTTVGYARSGAGCRSQGRRRSTSHRRDAGGVLLDQDARAGRARQRLDHRSGRRRQGHPLRRNPRDRLATRRRQLLVRGPAGCEGRDVGFPGAGGQWSYAPAGAPAGIGHLPAPERVRRPLAVVRRRRLGTQAHAGRADHHALRPQGRSGLARGEERRGARVPHVGRVHGGRCPQRHRAAHPDLLAAGQVAAGRVRRQEVRDLQYARGDDPARAVVPGSPCRQGRLLAATGRGHVAGSSDRSEAGADPSHRREPREAG